MANQGQGTRLSRSMGSVGLARSITISIGIASNIVVARIIVAHSGVGGFSTVATISTLSLLVPFADFGVGAALVNETVDYRQGGSLLNYLRVVKAAIAISVGSALTLLSICSIVSLTVGWTRVLGPGIQGLHHPNLTVIALAAIVALGVPAGLGARVLQGTGQVLSIMVIQGTIPLVTLLWMLGAWAFSAPLEVYCLAAPAAVTLSGLFVARRAILSVRISLTETFRSDPALNLYRSVLVGGISFTVITISLALAFQTDRIVLSHRSNSQELAIYALITPVYAAAMSLVAMTGQLLWPHYRQTLAAGRLTLSTLHRHIAGLGTMAVVLGLVSILALPTYADLASGGAIAVPWRVGVAIVTLLGVQALHLPSAYLLTDSEGFRFGAYLSVPMALCSIILSILLAPGLGAAGVLLASAVAVLLVQAIPTYRKARSLIRSQSSASQASSYANEGRLSKGLT